MSETTLVCRARVHGLGSGERVTVAAHFCQIAGRCAAGPVPTETQVLALRVTV